MSVSVARFPSLETRWLQRKEKWMTQAPVVVASVDSYGGCCYQPWSGEAEVDGRYFDLRCGLIVLSDYYRNDDKGFAESLAHEWRHHWQHLAVWNNRVKQWDNVDTKPYRARIVEYFTTQRHEMDALTFSLKVAPSDNSLQWMEWIMESRAA